MADVFSKQKRSEIMSRIRGKGNHATELALATLLRRNHITGWRRHRRLVLLAPRGSSQSLRKLSTRPDFLFPAPRIVVFVDGCFWHGCAQHCKMPSSNTGFWREKLASNRRRDSLVNRLLRDRGWTVIRLWEHQLADSGDVCVHRIRRALDS